MQVDGSCHCGAVSYVADIDPQRVSLCHCRDCQTFSSSAYRLSVVTARSNVRLTGSPKAYAKTAESGAVRMQHFCPQCGTPVFNSGPDSAVGDWVIRWGTIRQRDQLRPARQIWFRSAATWIDHLAEVPGRETV